MSEVRKVRDKRLGNKLIAALSLTKVIPPVPAQTETDWVKRVKITSKLASTFWGHSMTLGAVVLLPKGYNENASKRYPVVYTARSLQRARSCSDLRSRVATSRSRRRHAKHVSRRTMREPGCEFQQAWTTGKVPEVIAVFIQHTTPYYDDSYVPQLREQRPVRRCDHAGADFRDRQAIPHDRVPVRTRAHRRLDGWVGRAGAADPLP